MLKKFVSLTALGLSVCCHQGYSAQIASGYDHTLILSNTVVYGWGLNTDGQLGTGFTGTNATWVKATNTINFDSVATGQAFSLGLSNGVVYAWGNDSTSQLGNGSGNNSSLIAKAVSGLSGVTNIAAGKRHALALTSGNILWAWGINAHGEMGQGNETGTVGISPVQVNLSGITDIAAGDDFSLAVLTNGTVWAWGLGTSGQLGDGADANSAVPVQVSGLTGVASVDAGNGFAIALKTNGTVWTWGLNNLGQLGDGTFTTRLEPVQCGSLSNIVAICAGGSHGLALHTNGQVFSWGSGNYGQLGDGEHGRNGGSHRVSTPAIIEGISNVVEMVAGTVHSVLLTSGEEDLEIWVFGHQKLGQLGNGQFDYQSFVSTNGVQGITNIVAGGTHMLALKTNKTVLAWGNNNGSQLGINNTEDHIGFPVNVDGLTNVTVLSASLERSLAISGGTVYSWGSGDEIPVQVGNLTGVSAIAAGLGHGLAISNGIVWAWGAGSAGQLGWGNSGSPSPGVIVQAVGLTGATNVAAGSTHSLAISGGNVWAWGSEVKGRLGNGSASGSELSPIQIANLQNVTAISANTFHSLAISNGYVVAWGENSEWGHLGNGTDSDSLVPTLVSDAVLYTTNVTVVLNEQPLIITNYSTTISTNNVNYPTTTNEVGNSHIVVTSACREYTSTLNVTTILFTNICTNITTTITTNRMAGSIVAISAGKLHSLAMSSDGLVWAWGSDLHGQLGQNWEAGTYSRVPIAVKFAESSSGYLDNAIAIAAGDDFSAALLDDGRIVTWGHTHEGQLGNGNTGYKAVPTAQPFLP